VVVIAVAGCASSSHPTATSAAPTTTASTTPSTTGSTIATTTTTTAPSCADTQSCAQALYAAWKQGDRAAAAKVAAPAAVTKMFSHPYAPIQTSSGPQDPFRFTNCTGAAGSAICVFDGQDQQIQMRVRNSTGGLPIEVEEVKWFEGSPLKEVP